MDFHTDCLNNSRDHRWFSFAYILKTLITAVLVIAKQDEASCLKVRMILTLRRSRVSVRDQEYETLKEFVL